MKKIKIAFFFLLYSCPFFSSAQMPSFPLAWQGEWKGSLHWYRSGNDTARLVEMQLNIRATDSTAWLWQLTYGADAADKRPYLLLPVDTEKGHWVIDEQNGILLDQFYIGNRLTGSFTVMKNTILNSYQLMGDSLIVEFHSMSAEPLRQSGSGNEESPHVKSYRVTGYQRAVLRRKS